MEGCAGVRVYGGGEGGGGAGARVRCGGGRVGCYRILIPSPSLTCDLKDGTGVVLGTGHYA